MCSRRSPSRILKPPHSKCQLSLRLIISYVLPTNPRCRYFSPSTRRLDSLESRFSDMQSNMSEILSILRRNDTDHQRPSPHPATGPGYADSNTTKMETPSASAYAAGAGPHGFDTNGSARPAGPDSATHHPSSTDDISSLGYPSSTSRNHPIFERIASSADSSSLSTVVPSSRPHYSGRVHSNSSLNHELADSQHSSISSPRHEVIPNPTPGAHLPPSGSGHINSYVVNLSN